MNRSHRVSRARIAARPALTRGQIGDAGSAFREVLTVAIFTPVGIVLLGGVMVAVEKLSPILNRWLHS